MSDIQEEMKRQYKKAKDNDKNTNDIQLENLINMMKEFDYKKNGKQATLEFLLIMYQYFYEIDF